MKLTTKWILWYTLAAVYALILGALFYFNMFKFVFDKKLQGEIAELVRPKTTFFVKNLTVKPFGAAVFDEAELLNEWVDEDERIVNIIYLNYRGMIRWHKRGKYIGTSYDVYENEVGFETDAISRAYTSRQPYVEMFGDKNYYDMAIPLKAKGDEVVGIINIQFSRVGAKALIKRAMLQFFVGSIAILALMGFGLFMMFYYKVISPINSMKDSIESISTKSFNFAFLERDDEIEGLARAVSKFLGKVKGELETFEDVSAKSHVAEKSWWKTVVNITTAKNEKAIVVDENNMVLYANFKALKGKSKIHLLDIFDSANSDIIQLVSMAMEKPGKVYDLDTEFQGKTLYVKVAKVDSGKDVSRILIILKSKKNKK